MNVKFLTVELLLFIFFRAGKALPVTPLLSGVFVNRWFSPDATAAMLVHRTIIEKKVFWEFDSIIMQSMRHNLLLFCTPTSPTYHVIENHL